MKVVLQRSKKSSVSIDNKINGQIDKGFVALVGFCEKDDELILDKMIDKIINLRVFEDENALMNKSILDINGSILSISQFTLYANCKKGRRPSFVDALNPTEALELYQKFNIKLEQRGIKVEKGVFAADMKVEITNDGPVTIILDSNELF